MYSHYQSIVIQHLNQKHKIFNEYEKYIIPPTKYTQYEENTQNTNMKRRRIETQYTFHGI